MQTGSRRGAAAGIRTAGIGLLCGLTAVSPLIGEGAGACAPAGSVLRLGFYAHFEPVSYSADPDPASPGFDDHRGYEADLLTALEAMEGANLTFDRGGIGAWDGIWQQPVGTEYDIVAGGITILDSRTRDASGRSVVVFTAGHITFRQSLLVRAADAERLSGHRDLTGADRVGVLTGTTGEARFLELTGIADAAGVLAAGTRVETAGGVVVADGSADYVVGAAGATLGLGDRQRLRPVDEETPQVVYFTEEAAMIDALAAGRIDALARGEVGNRSTARAHGGALVVTALDARAETGGFALAAKDAELAECLDRHIAWLTDNGRIGYREWHEAPVIFLWRARQWPGPE
ncbi:MAG: transporter substrate-binding domain-containing protein [Spirochaetaceae bacterium]|nr:transporter substrate-binding domain-containing protein [Spirochaetaceae bacterium]